MIKECYRVRYRVGNTNREDTVMLYSASESEAIATLKARGSVPRDMPVVILTIVKR
jgi:hypothetical protein